MTPEEIQEFLSHFKIVHVVIGGGKMVHRASVKDNGPASSPLCGSGIHGRKFCTTSRTKIVDYPLTCKKCIAADNEKQAEAQS